MNQVETISISIKNSYKPKKATIFNNLSINEGKNIILVSDYFPDNENFEDKVTPWGKTIPKYGISDSAAIVLQKLLFEKNIKSITLYPLVTYSTLEVESGERKFRYEEAFNNLDKLIEKRNKECKIDGILFSGFWELDSEYKNTFNAKKFGRIELYKNIPAMHTLSLNRICPDKNGEDSEDLASLIGFFCYHLDILLEGRNRYTLDLNNWKVTLIDNIDSFKILMKEIEESSIISLDTETTGLSRTQEKLLTIQIATSPKKAYIIPYQHKESPFNSEELKYISESFKRYFEFGKSKFHIYQNAKFDISQFITHFKLKYYNHHIYDLMAGSFQLEESRKFLSSVGILKPYTLGFLAKEYGGDDIFEKGELGKEDRGNLVDQKLKDIIEYGAKDVILPFQIAKFQIEEAKRRGDKKFLKVVAEQISNIIYCFTIMEHNGFLVDKNYLMEMKSNNSLLTKGLNEVEEELKSLPSTQKANDLLLEKNHIPLTGGLIGKKRWLFELNKEESQQLLFFDVLGIKPLKAKKNGGGSIGKDFKEAYKKDFKEVALLDKFDKIRKVKSTFIDAHFERYSKDKDLCFDNRLRSSYQFTGVVTGRVSSSDPNLQQIPSRGEYANVIKRQFIADSNCLILHADYSAHEVRNWGNVSKDEKVCAAFDQGKQIRKKLRYYFSSDSEIWEKFRNFQKETKWVVSKDSNDKALNYEEKKSLIEKIQDKKLKKISELMFDLENKGDVHKLNYEFFFGVPAYLVNKQQRQSVKAVVFGVIYGKGAKTLADDLKGKPVMTREEAIEQLKRDGWKPGDKVKHYEK